MDAVSLIHRPGLRIALHRIELCAVRAVLREDEPFERGFLEHMRLRIDVIEIDFHRLPSGLFEDVLHRLYPLVVRPGRDDDDIIASDRVYQVHPVLLALHPLRKRPEHLV